MESPRVYKKFIKTLIPGIFKQEFYLYKYDWGIHVVLHDITPTRLNGIVAADRRFHLSAKYPTHKSLVERIKNYYKLQ